MITKFNKFNEGISHLLVGPTDEEIWDNYMNGDLKGLLKSIPTSPEDFFNQIKEDCIQMGENEDGVYYGKNGVKLFQVNIEYGLIFINYNYIWSILENVYELEYDDTFLLIKSLLVDSKWNNLSPYGDKFRFN